MIESLVIVAVAVAAQLVLAWRAEQRTGRLEEWFVARQEALDAADEGRRQALYKQQKASERTVAQSNRAVSKLADETRRLNQDSRSLHGRVDTFFADRRVQRMLDKGDDRG